MLEKQSQYKQSSVGTTLLTAASAGSEYAVVCSSGPSSSSAWTSLALGDPMPNSGLGGEEPHSSYAWVSCYSRCRREASNIVVSLRKLRAVDDDAAEDIFSGVICAVSVRRRHCRRLQERWPVEACKDSSIWGGAVRVNVNAGGQRQIQWCLEAAAEKKAGTRRPNTGAADHMTG
jgi:hypothetical protein